MGSDHHQAQEQWSLCSERRPVEFDVSWSGSGEVLRTGPPRRRGQLAGTSECGGATATEELKVYAFGSISLEVSLYSKEARDDWTSEAST